MLLLGKEICSFTSYLTVSFLILHSLLNGSDYGSEHPKLKIREKDMSYRTFAGLKVMIAVCFF